MSNIDYSQPREAARAFTPTLSAFVDNTLYPDVWGDSALGLRDRSLVTVAALIAAGHTDELPAHLRRAVGNGVTREELAAAITHLAFYVGFPQQLLHRRLHNTHLPQHPKAARRTSNESDYF